MAESQPNKGKALAKSLEDLGFQNRLWKSESEAPEKNTRGVLHNSSYESERQGRLRKVIIIV